nr:immunoglobulin heavy chain junction region [Macaca mulatta]MOV54017.1 immunoglobulin heavy chain junction region [Macaca mulatta]MOV55766.1 immunoglobulin heavy chain junction region [Macaca mulatta]
CARLTLDSSGWGLYYFDNW